MGLKSLALLNKSGISMYWSNVWDSIKLYKKYSFSFFLLHDIIYYFLNENLYYYCILKVRILKSGFKGIKGRKKININKLRKEWNMRNFYLGKILFYNNQGWTIVIINYCSTKRLKLFKKYKNSKLFNKLFKTYRFDYFNYKFKRNNYKFKF